ncbi:hypothetical protein BESB_063590 [Besnoitia besnoiti]|uniref:Uncharacterized protein n=1 Tax=Besnoitia besnoiti TaxID=94643 RepID=A0A2A9MJB5_BESBE|nr:hypothetical protein BESB_063590 [Besnoitia besnoiti]PFH35472.1 hypothetical protein BESB_063590 [Besnoitia besnoiti]
MAIVLPSSCAEGPVDPLAGSSSPKRRSPASLSPRLSSQPNADGFTEDQARVPLPATGRGAPEDEDLLRGIGETAASVLKDMTSWVSGHFHSSMVPAVRSSSAIQKLDGLLFPPAETHVGSTVKVPLTRPTHPPVDMPSASARTSASRQGAALLSARQPAVNGTSHNGSETQRSSRSLVDGFSSSFVSPMPGTDQHARHHRHGGLSHPASASARSTQINSLSFVDTSGVSGDWSFKPDGLFSSFLSLFDVEDEEAYPPAPRGFPGQPPSFGSFHASARPAGGDAFSHRLAVPGRVPSSTSLVRNTGGTTARFRGPAAPAPYGFLPLNGVPPLAGRASPRPAAPAEFYNGGSRAGAHASFLGAPADRVDSSDSVRAGDDLESPLVSPRSLEEPADGTVKPQTWLDYSAGRTMACVTRSHVELSLLVLHNVGKVVCSTVVSGQARLRCPGFNMLNLRIPLYDLQNQVISVAFAVRMSHSHAKVLQMLDRGEYPRSFRAPHSSHALASDSAHGGQKLRYLKQLDWHRRTDEDRKRDTRVVHFRVDIPVSAAISEGPVWVCLTEDRPVVGVTTEELFSRLSDKAENKIFQPRLQFSIRKNLTGIISVPIEPQGTRQEHVYVGQYDDPIDIAVANGLAGQSQLLSRKQNITRLSHGKYDIDGYRCSIFLRPRRFFAGVGPDATSLETTTDDEGEEADGASGDKILIVDEGGAQQPLLDYLKGSLANIIWEEQKCLSAIELVDSHLLPSFEDTSIPWEAKVDRRVAMALACHRAAIREQVAAELLRVQGREPPSLLYEKHANPVSLRLAPHTPPVRVTYTWGDEYSDIQLVVMEDRLVPPTTTDCSRGVTTTQEAGFSIN